MSVRLVCNRYRFSRSSNIAISSIFSWSVMVGSAFWMAAASVGLSVRSLSFIFFGRYFRHIRYVGVGHIHELGQLFL